MNYYLVSRLSEISDNNNFPCLVLRKEKNWNDYRYYILFRMYHFKTKTNSKELGFYRIMHNTGLVENIPPFFQELDSSYCSLASSEDFYYNFYQRDPDNIKNFLLGLNDVSLKKEYFDIFKDNECFNKALLRGTSVDFVKENFGKIITGTSIVFNQDFKYQYKIKDDEESQSITFSFKSLNNDCPIIPYRINCLIGKNATGKTTLLAKLAKSLCSPQSEYTKKEFPKGRPYFNKIITISFSIFDNFAHLESQNKAESDIAQNYYYCGFHDKNGKLIKEEDINDQLFKCWKRIQNDSTLSKDWIELLTIFLSSESVKLFDSPTDIQKEYLFEMIDKAELSSGQFMIFYFLTHTLANIKQHSLILFDEPELHLHPNAISQLMNLLYELLNKTESFAIIATHSPIIVQQIPSNYVHVMNRDELDHSISPQVETFGENLSAITRDIFDNIDNDSYYKKILEDAKLMTSAEFVKKLFKNKLGLNATIFLENIKDE